MAFVAYIDLTYISEIQEFTDFFIVEVDKTTVCVHTHTRTRTHTQIDTKHWTHFYRVEYTNTRLTSKYTGWTVLAIF